MKTSNTITAWMQQTNYLYAPCFCEENIWHLGKTLAAQGLSAEAMTVLLLTNAHRQIPLFNQKLAPQAQYMFWDYHVILHQRGNSLQDSLIYDFDSRLSFPIAADKYYQHTFPLAEKLPSAYHIDIRPVPLKRWLKHFTSDRSHMRATNGKPQQPFPRWPMIQGIPGISLQSYLDTHQPVVDDCHWISFTELPHCLEYSTCRERQRYSHSGHSLGY